MRQLAPWPIGTLVVTGSGFVRHMSWLDKSVWACHGASCRSGSHTPRPSSMRLDDVPFLFIGIELTLATSRQSSNGALDMLLLSPDLTVWRHRVAVELACVEEPVAKQRRQLFEVIRDRCRKHFRVIRRGDTAEREG